jgi:hypothetical protein
LRTTFDTSFQLSEIASFAYLNDFLFRVRRFFGAAAAAAAFFSFVGILCVGASAAATAAVAAAGGNAGIYVPSLGDDVVKVIVFLAFALLGLAWHGSHRCNLRGEGDVLTTARRRSRVGENVDGEKM